MTISTLPAAPSRSDPPATFVAKADAFVAALATLVSETNALATQLNAMVGAVTAGTVISIPVVYRSTTTDADPGADGNGSFRLNQATENTATFIYLDDKNSSGTDVLATLDTFDASTSATKGQVRLQKTSDSTAFLLFNVTALTKVGSTYRKLTVVNIGSSAASPFTTGDGVTLTYTQTGDVGTFSGTISNQLLTGIKVAAFNSVINNTDGGAGTVTVNWSNGAVQTVTEPVRAITFTFTAPGVSPCHLLLQILSDGTSSAFTHVFPGVGTTFRWLGSTWAAVANKGATISILWDGTTYWASGANEV